MAYGGRWNATVMSMAGGKAMMLTALRCYTELVEKCCRCYVTLCKGGCYCIPCCIRWILPCLPLSGLEVAYRWLLTGHLLLDLYCARLSQHLQTDHGPLSK